MFITVSCYRGVIFIRSDVTQHRAVPGTKTSLQTIFLSNLLYSDFILNFIYLKVHSKTDVLLSVFQSKPMGAGGYKHTLIPSGEKEPPRGRCDLDEDVAVESFAGWNDEIWLTSR